MPLYIKELSLLLLVGVLITGLYSESLHGPFTFDDNLNIVHNPNIRIGSFSLKDLRKSISGGLSSRRPVVKASFALNYLIHKYDAFGFRLTNVLIHILNTVLVYLFIKVTLSLPSLQARYGPPGWVPFATALVWAVSPLHIHSVTYIVQRMNSMAVMFYLLSFLCYIHGRLNESKKRWVYFSFSFLFGVFAFGSKEMTVTLPFFILLYEWYFFQELSSERLKSFGIKAIATLLFIVVMGFVYLKGNPFASALTGYANRPFTLGQRLLTESRVLIYYLGLLFFPHPSRLALLHDFSLSKSLLAPITTVLSMFTISGLIAYAILFMRKQPLVSFCILWYFGNIFLESSFLPLEIIYEHRTYMPSIMIVLLTILLIHRFVKLSQLRLLIIVVIVLLSSYWTYDRNSVWSNEIELWRDNVAKFPLSTRTHHGLGYALKNEGKWNEALDEYNKSIELDPNNYGAYRDIGFILVQKKEPGKAVEYYKKAVAINPTSTDTHFRLSKALALQGKFDEAITHLRETIRLDPGHIEAKGHLEYLKQLQMIRNNE